MKRIIALTAILGFCGGTAFAVPYASQIRVQNILQPDTTNQTISYVLNQEADSVLIEIIDDSETVVASFDGTTDQGANSVAWDLTDDNDGGTPLGEIEDLRVRITVDADQPEGWAVYAMNQSEDVGDAFYEAGAFGAVNQKNLFTRFRPHSVFIPKDPDRDDFGTIALPGSETTWASVVEIYAAVVPVDTDLSPRSADGGLSSRVLRHPQSDALNEPGSFQDVWYGVEDPLNPGYYFITGQATSARTNVTYGTLADTIATNNNPEDVDLGGPRTAAILVDGSERRLLLAIGTDAINMYTIDANNEVEDSAPINLLGFTPGLYSKHVFFDSDGNLYWLSRGDGTTADTGRVYRWPASLIDSSLVAGALTDANADSVVTIASGGGLGLLGELAETPDGDIIVAAGGGADFIHLINLGNKSAASLTQEIAAADAFFSVTGLNSNVNTYAVGIDVDAFGNVYYAAANSLFGVWAITPGGETSTTVTGPTSQTFAITEITNARSWHLFE